MFLSLFYLASRSTSFFINKSLLPPIVRSIHPVLPYLGIWELVYITFSRVYFSPVACLLRDVFSIVDTLSTTFAYRLEEMYWSLAFWPILLRDAITGFPSFASDIAAAALRFFFGIASCRSPDFQKQRHGRNITRQTITISSQSGMNSGKDIVPPISLVGNARVQSTPRISLSQASPPTHPPDTTADGSTLPSVTASATTRTLLPNSLITRSQYERSTSTPTRGLTVSKRNKIPIYPSPPTICSPSATLRSSSAVFSATSIHKTVLINLPVNNVDSSRTGSAAFPSSVNTTLSSHTPSPQSPVMSSSSTPSTTTPVSSPHSSMLKFSTPPSPLRSRSKVKRIQSRKRTPATPCLSPISLLRRSPTPYPSHPNTSHASSPSLAKTTPSTPTTPKAKTRSTANTVVTTPTPKSKSQSQQQHQVGKGNRGSGRKGNARGSAPGNAHASGGNMENRSERHRHLV